MSIFNLNNWFNSFVPKNKRSKTLKDNDIIAFGRKDQSGFNGFIPVGITVKDLKEELGGESDPNVPIKTYCAEILNLGPGTTPQVEAVLVNTFDGTIVPEANLPSPLGDGVTKILSLDNEFTVDKTMVTITLLETTTRVNDFVKGLGAGFVNINFEQSSNGIFTPVNNVKILVKIEVYA